MWPPSMAHGRDGNDGRNDVCNDGHNDDYERNDETLIIIRNYGVVHHINIGDMADHNDNYDG